VPTIPIGDAQPGAVRRMKRARRERRLSPS
jgi:hypothetical protein